MSTAKLLAALFLVCLSFSAQASGMTTVCPMPQPMSLLQPASQTVNPCHKQCAPLGAIKPRSEASRVYLNCRALCDRKGVVTCPDGRTVSWKTPKCN